MFSFQVWLTFYQFSILITISLARDCPAISTFYRMWMNIEDALLYCNIHVHISCFINFLKLQHFSHDGFNCLINMASL